MLQQRLLGCGGHPGERLEAEVDLQRVGGHRHGVLADGPQPRGERDRDGGLADAGGAEEREYLHWRSLTGKLGGPRPAFRRPRHPLGWIR